MKATYEHIKQDSSHIQLWISQPYFEFYWHYHPEIELTFIVKGSGERIVGDHIESFTAGDLVLVGPNLPHTWTSYEAGSASGSCQAMVVQFRAEVFEFKPGSYEEFDQIRNLISLSVRGIKFSQFVAEEAGRQMMLLRDKQGLPWLTGFWSVLDFLGNSKDITLLSSAGYSPSLKRQSRERTDKVFQFMNQHLAGDIRLKHAADLVCMTETSFSRFFRKNTGITFNGYLNELRISKACRLLTDHPEKSISEVAWESGFRSSTHFNRAFRVKKKCSPSEYRKISNPRMHR